jgi:hypothetical protein
MRLKGKPRFGSVSYGFRIGGYQLGRPPPPFYWTDIADSQVIESLAVIQLQNCSEQWTLLIFQALPSSSLFGLTLAMYLR